MHSTGLTTPNPLQLQTQLRRWVNDGVQACAMEASSIGLAEHRLNGCHIRTAIFTNFTQDHLDYHGSMQAYWQAKQALFEWPGLSAAVINIDDPKGQLLCEQLAGSPVQVCTVSLHSTQAHVHARDVRTTAQGMSFEVVCGEQRQSVSAPCLGEFNVMNLLGVMAVLCQSGHSLSDVVSACHHLQAVPGRMQSWGQEGTPAVVVDYAHTPDAVAKALQALRPWAHARGGRLHCVLGSGGDRDSSKRAPMARSAEVHADLVCLTSDNPRSEDPQHIVQQMLAGMEQPDKALQQLDRANALQAGVSADAFVSGVHFASGLTFGVEDRHRQDFVFEGARLGRRGGTLVAEQGVAVEIVFAQAVFLGHHLGADKLAEHLVVVALVDLGALVETHVGFLRQHGGAEHGHAGHGLDTGGDHHIHAARHHGLCGKVNRLLGRTALAVDGGAGHRLGQLGGQHRVAGHVGRLLADLAHATHEHVFDQGRVCARAVNQVVQYLGRQIHGMPARQTTAATASSGSGRRDDESF
jgi:hypothetical protein